MQINCTSLVEQLLAHAVPDKPLRHLLNRVLKGVVYSRFLCCSHPICAMQQNPSHDSCTIHLVLASSLLASLKLVQIPPTDRQAALVLIHTPPEVSDIRLADLRRLVVRVHNGALLSLSHGLVGRRCCCRGTATEEAADGVADGGAYCDTTTHIN